jgi:hypothetical protein
MEYATEMGMIDRVGQSGHQAGRRSTWHRPLLLPEPRRQGDSRTIRRRDKTGWSFLARVRQQILEVLLGDRYKAVVGVTKDGSPLKDDALMFPSDLDRLTPLQRLIVEQAVVMAQELEAAADSAPNGQVLDHCESFLLGNGRAFLKKALESTLQSRAETLEKKGAPLESACVELRDVTKAVRPKR